MKELEIRLMERKLGGELTAHIGYEDGKVLLLVSSTGATAQPASA